MNEIAKLLQQKYSFEDGFRAFCKYSRNQSLMSWISRKKDFAMLDYNLRKLSRMPLRVNPCASLDLNRFGSGMPLKGDKAKAQKQVKAVDPEEEQEVVITKERKTRPVIHRDDLPEDLRGLYDENAQQYKVMRALHDKMKACNSDVGRADFRRQIMDMEKQIRERWRVIDTALDKTSPEKPATTKEPAFNVNSYRAYISKMLKRKELTSQQADGVRQRAAALIDSGVPIKTGTMTLLKEKGLV